MDEGISEDDDAKMNRRIREDDGVKMNGKERDRNRERYTPLKGICIS